MEVGAGIWAADNLVYTRQLCQEMGVQRQYHDCYMFIIHAVIIDWRFQEVGILLEPGCRVGLILCCFDHSQIQTILADSGELTAFYSGVTRLESLRLTGVVGSLRSMSELQYVSLYSALPFKRSKTRESCSYYMALTEPP